MPLLVEKDGVLDALVRPFVGRKGGTDAGDILEAVFYDGGIDV